MFTARPSLWIQLMLHWMQTPGGGVHSSILSEAYGMRLAMFWDCHHSFYNFFSLTWPNVFQISFPQSPIFLSNSLPQVLMISRKNQLQMKISIEFRNCIVWYLSFTKLLFYKYSVVAKIREFTDFIFETHHTYICKCQFWTNVTPKHHPDAGRPCS